MSPGWFNASSQGYSLDYLGSLKRPFTMTRGGYFVREKGGKAEQVYGKAMPEWRREVKQHPHSRGGQKVRHLAGHGVREAIEAGHGQ